jgi:aminoglycoside phosphotransferase (APT) family kinase protein
LHGLPPSGLPGADATPAGWRALLQSRRDTNLAALTESNLFSTPLLAEIDARLADLSTLAPAAFQPHPVNADLTEDHLLLQQTGVGWDLSAIIDWGDVQLGSPEYEWVALISAGRRAPAFFRQILAAYDPALRLDAAYRNRLTAMTLLHLFGPLILTELEPPPLDTWANLRDWLWPVELERS